jgi:hypothetical protein
MSGFPKECSKCLKKDGILCTAFKDPRFQWRDGHRCYGYVDDPAQMLKMYQEMYEYNMLKGEKAESIKRAVEYYQKLLSGKV